MALGHAIANPESLTISAAPPRPPALVGAAGPTKSRGNVSLLSLLAQGVGLCGLLTASYLFFSHFVVQTVRVEGPSMWPTLREADYCLVNHCVYLVRQPRRGEVVVLRDPTDGTYAVKRVIAAAGDTVALRDGAVYLNGQRLDEPYLLQGTQTYPFQTWEQVVHCGPGQYFVLGDNRFFSNDSRNYGPVSRHAILGLVLR